MNWQVNPIAPQRTTTMYSRSTYPHSHASDRLLLQNFQVFYPQLGFAWWNIMLDFLMVSQCAILSTYLNFIFMSLVYNCTSGGAISIFIANDVCNVCEMICMLEEPNSPNHIESRWVEQGWALKIQMNFSVSFSFLTS